MDILIIEDDRMMLKALESELTPLGHQIFSTPNGQKALEVVLTIKNIDLVISDIMMPIVTGPMFISLLRNYFYESTPVIVISSLNQGDQLLEKLGIDFDYFLHKPFKMNHLTSIVEGINTTPKILK